MSPARTTVERNVLVSDIGQVVLAVGIVPQPLVRKRDILKRALDDRSSGLVRLLVAWLIFSNVILGCNQSN
jgi:hypothetical protein